MKKLLFVFTAAAVVLTSCTKEKGESKAGIFKGPETTMHEGKAWTWVQLDKDGNPERVAIAVNENALNSMPADDGSGGAGHDHDNNVILSFPSQAANIAFKHVWANWNPAGHPPANIYTKPHFDFHFYTVSSAERETFVDPAKLAASVPAEYLPANYIGIDPVPTMGKHYVDVTSPELNGQPFTETFILGSYDAKINFYEPMITLEFLKATTTYERSIPQPAKYQQSGYYPTKMRIQKAAQATNIILEGFVYRTAS
jgi:hypothetical protein